jgi:hypothetical protein
VLLLGNYSSSGSSQVLKRWLLLGCHVQCAVVLMSLMQPPALRFQTRAWKCSSQPATNVGLACFSCIVLCGLSVCSSLLQVEKSAADAAHLKAEYDKLLADSTEQKAQVRLGCCAAV